jgi:hypothetical protein
MRLDDYATYLRLFIVALIVGFSIILIYKFYKIIEALPLVSL